MNKNQHKEQLCNEEIDLRDLFVTLWKRKVIVVSIILIVAFVTGFISMFLITPVYHSRLNIIINMPETYHTRFGDYNLPLTNNEQYINLITSNDIISRTIKDMGYDPLETTIESLRDRITIKLPDNSTSGEQNSFFVSVAAKSPVETKKLAQTLFDNYVEFIDILTIEGALDFHVNRFKVALKSNEVSLTKTKETLAKNEALLADTPQTINQRDAMDEIQNADNFSDYIVLENVINPNYTKIEGDIIDNMQSINSIENSMRIYNEYLVELDSIREKVRSHKKNGDYSKISTELVSVTETNVYLPSAPVEPSRKTSPSNAMNVIIGAILGGMVAVFIVLIKEYWFKTEQK